MQQLHVLRHLSQLHERFTPTPRGKKKDKRTESSTIKTWLLDFRLFSRLRGKGELKEVPACYLFRQMLITYLAQHNISPQDLLSADELDHFTSELNTFGADDRPASDPDNQTVAA